MKLAIYKSDLKKEKLAEAREALLKNKIVGTPEEKTYLLIENATPLIAAKTLRVLKPFFKD